MRWVWGEGKQPPPTWLPLANDVPSPGPGPTVFPLETATVHLQLSQLDVAEDIGVCGGGGHGVTWVSRDSRWHPHGGHSHFTMPSLQQLPAQPLLPESSRSPSHNKRNGGLSHLHTLAFAVPSARMPLLRRCCHTSAHPPKNICEMSVPSKPLTGKTDAASALTALAGTYTCSAPLSLALNTRLMLCLSPVPNTSPPTMMS